MGIKTIIGSDGVVSYNDASAVDTLQIETATVQFGASTNVQFSNISSSNLTGSLTRLADGTPYLVSGNSIDLTTGSNGAVTVGVANAITSVPGAASSIPIFTLNLSQLRSMAHIDMTVISHFPSKAYDASDGDWAVWKPEFVIRRYTSNLAASRILYDNLSGLSPARIKEGSTFVATHNIYFEAAIASNVLTVTGYGDSLIRFVTSARVTTDTYR